SVISGQTLLTIADPPPAVPLVKGGQLRALAVTGAKRLAELPGGSRIPRREHRPVERIVCSRRNASSGYAETRNRAAPRDSLPRRGRQAQGAGRGTERDCIGRTAAPDRGRHQAHRRRGEGREPDVRGMRPTNSDSSCPAKAGHPVNTSVSVLFDTSVFTGSSAFADDDT